MIKYLSDEERFAAFMAEFRAAHPWAPSDHCQRIHHMLDLVIARLIEVRDAAVSKDGAGRGGLWLKESVRTSLWASKAIVHVIDTLLLEDEDQQEVEDAIDAAIAQEEATCPPRWTLTYDTGEVWNGNVDVEAFIKDNVETLDPHTVQWIRAAQPGDEVRFGGGAAPRSILRRIR
jgi:hypothetical protein